jgi:hypothetical protein
VVTANGQRGREADGHDQRLRPVTVESALAEDLGDEQQSECGRENRVERLAVKPLDCHEPTLIPIAASAIARESDSNAPLTLESEIRTTLHGDARAAGRVRRCAA